MLQLQAYSYWQHALYVATLQYSSKARGRAHIAAGKCCQLQAQQLSYDTWL